MVSRLLLLAAVAILALTCTNCAPGAGGDPTMTEVQRVRSGSLDVVLLARTDALRQTRNDCALEFRTGTDHHPVDVGTVRVRTTMSMEGVPMSGFVTDVKRVATGRYELEIVMAMAGTWQISVDWEGAAGTGSAMFEALVP
jgi:hypothetical protein